MIIELGKTVIPARLLHRSLLDDYQDWDVQKISTGFSIDEIRSIYESIQSEFDFYVKDNVQGYDGLALQTSLKEESLNEGVQNYYTARALNLPFDLPSKLNSVGKRYKFIVDEFPGLQLCRGRILRIAPGVEYNRHTDGPRSRRLHIPIYSEVGAEFVIEEKVFHLIADGSAYITNTEKIHFIRNKSTCRRVHLVFDI